MSFHYIQKKISCYTYKVPFQTNHPAIRQREIRVATVGIAKALIRLVEEEQN